MRDRIPLALFGFSALVAMLVVHGRKDHQARVAIRPRPEVLDGAVEPEDRSAAFKRTVTADVAPAHEMLMTNAPAKPVPVIRMASAGSQ